MERQGLWPERHPPHHRHGGGARSAWADSTNLIASRQSAEAVVDPGLDLERSLEPLLVLTGDCLLAGDAGRPDFSGGDAFAQYESMQRLLMLPEWLPFFPGYFEGPCGVTMRGVPTTTTGCERRFNPLANLDRADFVARLVGSVPPRPLNITAIEAPNRGHADQPWAMLTRFAAVPSVTVDELAAPGDAPVVLDVREPVEYG